MADIGVAPAYVIQVNGVDLDHGVQQFVTSLEFESADGYADAAKIQLINPDFVLTDKRIFQPGNEMSIWLGYGSDLTHVGRVKIAKYRPTWPDAGDMPTIEVIGYSKDHDMMDNEPSKVKKVPPSSNSKAAKKSAKKKNEKLKASEGRHFKNATYADAVEAKAADYGFLTDIDPTPDQPHDFWQKAGLTDYQFVQGMANHTGFVFWVDGDANGNWTLHFRDPEKGLVTQSKIFDFVYNDEFATLLSFDGEMKFAGVQSKIVVETKNPLTGKIMQAEFEQNPATEDPLFVGDLIKNVTPATTRDAREVLLVIGDLQVSTVTNKAFRNEAELIFWAKQWFRRNAEQFVMGEGRIIGDPRVLSRQTHKLSNLGSQFSGKWYFTRVSHQLSADNGYTCEFTARRLLDNSATDESDPESATLTALLGPGLRP